MMMLLLLLLAIAALRIDATLQNEPLVDLNTLSLGDLVELTGLANEADFTTWILLADEDIFNSTTGEVNDLGDNLRSKEGLWTCDINKKRSVSERARLARDGTIKGVNIGGWLVPELWLNPSLYYQFLGRTDPEQIAMDPFSFCQVLGPEEGNRQMRRHWASWLLEEDIAQLAEVGITDLRVPVGDWMFVPYGPYVGCMDGALDELDRLLSYCEKYGIGVLLDIHAIKDSQNGLDSSGKTQDVLWVNATEEIPAQFVHWDLRSAHWLGDFDHGSQHYTSFNFDNFLHSLRVVTRIAELYGEHGSVWGLQGVNEPWDKTPPNALGMYNWLGYAILKKGVKGGGSLNGSGGESNWIWVLHDSFRALHPLWRYSFQGCEDVVLDTHIYFAWDMAGKPEWYIRNACDKRPMARVRQDSIPLFVGEWSLATDNCAMWLNGFQDNAGGYPQVECERVQCPDPYMGSDQPNAPPDPGVRAWTPIGTGQSMVENGTCPTQGIHRSKSRSGSAPLRLYPEQDDSHFSTSRPGQDASDTMHDTYEQDVFITTLNTALLATIHGVASGFFFWNFKTELPEPRWNFFAAHARGWFPQHLSELDLYEADGLFSMVCDQFPEPDAPDFSSTTSPWGMADVVVDSKQQQQEQAKEEDDDSDDGAVRPATDSSEGPTGSGRAGKAGDSVKRKQQQQQQQQQPRQHVSLLNLLYVGGGLIVGVVFVMKLFKEQQPGGGGGSRYETIP